ncbi:MAG: hypothetical protein ACKPKO_47815, partial [Candidatus Fonsibacter sp.]
YHNPYSNINHTIIYAYNNNNNNNIKRSEVRYGPYLRKPPLASTSFQYPLQLQHTTATLNRKRINLCTNLKAHNLLQL